MTIGYQGTNTVTQTRVVVEMEDVIAQLDPNAAPFTSLTMRLAKETVENPMFEWHEDEFAPRWDAIDNAAGFAADDNALTTDNIDYFTQFDLIKVPRTGEVIHVTSVDYTNGVLNVVRGIGGTAAAALLDDEPLQIIGNAMAEGSPSRQINTRPQTRQFNYTQIFKLPFGVTNTLKATKLYGGNDLDYQRKKKGVEHRLDIERAFLFGERSIDVTTYDHPLRTTGGLLERITTNVMDAGQGAPTEAEVDSWAEMLFDKGSDTKIVFASNAFLTAVASFAKNRLIIEQGEKTYGLKIGTYVTPFGTMKIVPHKLLTGVVYGNYAIGVDLKNVKYVNLKGRGTKLESNIQGNDEDRQKDQYITECGLKVKLEETHSLLFWQP